MHGAHEDYFARVRIGDLGNKLRDAREKLTVCVARSCPAMIRDDCAQRLNEVQRALRLSSPSLAQYHISKLLRAGLIKESENGYTVDRVLFGNLVRVRRMVVPFQITYTILFASALVVMLTALATVGAVIYNLVTHVAGGVEVTLREAD